MVGKCHKSNKINVKVCKNATLNILLIFQKKSHEKNVKFINASKHSVCYKDLLGH